MVRYGFVAGLVAAVALAGASIAFTAASRARAQRAAATSAAGVTLPGQRLHTITEVPFIDHPGPRPAVAAHRTAAVAAHHHAVRPPADVLSVRRGRTISLRDRPGGRVIALLGDRTAFGSPTTLSVAARRGRWAGVPSPALPNGRLGWVDTRDGGLRAAKVDVRLVVRLAYRRLELRIKGRLVRSVPVAIGRPGSSTPTGRFSITDEIVGTRFGPYYGCCILALSGHQPHRPLGWTGGDRLAIHGTNAPSSIGTPSSAGCLRAADADLHVLMRRVPLGTPVTIR
jgi:lipoprotein-anchoring transpeptidase ErfK/SrfK